MVRFVDVPSTVVPNALWGDDDSVKAAVGHARAPLIVVEDDVAQRAVSNEVIGAGWVLRRAERGTTDLNAVMVMVVANQVDAQAAVLLAISGSGLLVRADAERWVIDDLLEDLGRIGPVLLVDPARTVSLEPATWRLLHSVANGTTIAAAAHALHMSTRTAHRRITDAKHAVGARTRAQVLRALAAPDRIPGAPINR